jgi:hypothetical protein
MPSVACCYEDCVYILSRKQLLKIRMRFAFLVTVVIVHNSLGRLQPVSSTITHGYKSKFLKREKVREDCPGTVADPNRPEGYPIARRNRPVETKHRPWNDHWHRHRSTSAA